IKRDPQARRRPRSAVDRADAPAEKPDSFFSLGASLRGIIGSAARERLRQVATATGRIEVVGSETRTALRPGLADLQLGMARELVRFDRLTAPRGTVGAD